MPRPTDKRYILVLLLSLCEPALAHPGHANGGFPAGFMHPLTGFDHLLAMVAIGLWAAQNGGKKMLLLPGAFMTTLAGGTALSLLWPGLPWIEHGIALSVLALGLLCALALRIGTTACLAIAGSFGLLHGYAHGLELPSSASPMAYASGFLSSTLLLHVSGIGVGMAARRTHPSYGRSIGYAITLAGAYLLWQ